MYTRCLPAVLLVCLTSTFRVAAHNGERYTVPRTEHGHPDEYACHENNYSLPNILRGGQAEAARFAAEAQEQR